MAQIQFLLTPFGERASKAGTVSLLGMLAIFGVLALLWGAIELFHFGITAAQNKKAKQPDENKEVTQLPSVKETADDGALVAAITAAITAARAEEGNTTGFRVVSFRRSR